VSSDVFRVPDRPGRPPGVFNADCWGTTPQDPNEPRVLVKQSEEPNTAARFPMATAFTSRAQAALECDFWKLVLRRHYYLEIPWSHGTIEAYLEAAQMACVPHPLERLKDESQWTHELLDFIAQHQSQLFQHRDAHKPELDLDGFERWARENYSYTMMGWVHHVRSLQNDLSSLPKQDRLHTLSKHLTHLSGCRLPESSSNPVFARRLSALATGISATAGLANDCDTLIIELEDERRRITYDLKKLIESRPPMIADPNVDKTQPFYFQGDVS
jgi:hypothetical protein